MCPSNDSAKGDYFPVAKRRHSFRADSLRSHVLLVETGSSRLEGLGFRVGPGQVYTAYLGPKGFPYCYFGAEAYVLGACFSRSPRVHGIVGVGFPGHSFALSTATFYSRIFSIT